MRSWLKIAAMIGTLLVAAPTFAALPPVQPMGLRPTSNGFSVLVADEGQGKLSQFWPHLYANRTAGETTPNLLFDAYFGLKVAGGTAKWGKDLPHPQPFAACQAGKPCAANDSQFGYLDATGIVHDLKVLDGVTIDTIAFAPNGLPLPAGVILARLTNPGATAVTVDVALLLNFHLGAGAPDPTADGETLQLQGQKILSETGASAWQAAYIPLDGANSGTAGPATPDVLETTNPYAKFVQSGLSGWQSAPSQGSDRVAGMGWKQWTLQPGETRTLGALVLAVPKGALDAALLVTDVWLQGRLPQKVLDDEQAQWQAWHQLDVIPKGLNAEEQLLLRRALTVLRMAQVREPDPPQPKPGDARPFGQIVAALPPGVWHIAWVRDQAYAAVALATGGHPAEARDAIDFVRHGQTGGYASYFGGAYLPSPVRYFGSGLEESDSNADGPNIEFDGLGLCLWQAARYLQASGDKAWLAQAWPELRDKAAIVLQKLIDDQGLVAKDSSIWEVHWNGKQKHFTYTSVLGVRGLCAAAGMAAQVGDTTLATSLRKSAKDLRDTIVAQLVGADQVLRGNLEEAPAQAMDAAAVEAFLDGQIDVTSPMALATLQAWQKALAAGGGPGFFRNDDGGEYDSAEWLFIDLRIWRLTQRMVAAGLKVDALEQALHARVLDTARAGGGLLPELLATQGTGAGQFAGAIPMVGFGAGALVLALADASQDDDLASCLVDAVKPGEDAGAADAGADAGADVLADAGADAGTDQEIAGQDAVDAQDVAVADVGALPDVVAVVDVAAAPDAAAKADLSVAAPDVQASASGSSGSASSCQASRAAGSGLGWMALLALGLLARRRYFRTH